MAILVTHPDLETDPNATDDYGFVPETTDDVDPAECPHRQAVCWDPWLEVVCCHRCGTVFVPATPQLTVRGQVREGDGG